MTDGDLGKPDSVPGVVYGQVQSVPTEKILLRLTSGFIEKARKFEKYIEEGIVGKEDKLIVAIDLSGVSHAILADKEEMSLACKAFVEIGELTMSIPVRPNEGKTETFYSKREPIKKVEGAEIPATVFLMDQFKYIGGVITNVSSFTKTVQNPNSLRLLLNQIAQSKLDIGNWKFLRDIHYEEGGFLKKWPEKGIS